MEFGSVNQFANNPGQTQQLGKCIKCGTVFPIPLGKQSGDQCFCNQCGSRMEVNIATAAFLASHFEQLRRQAGIEEPDFLILDGELGIYRKADEASVVTVPDEVVSIRQLAFHNSAITGIHLPANLKSIGMSAFGRCKNLKEIMLPPRLESLGPHAFSECTSLEGIYIPHTVQRIEDFTFFGCTSLSRVYLEEGLESIGTYAFGNCTALTHIRIPGTVTQVDPNAFTGTGIQFA